MGVATLTIDICTGVLPAVAALRCGGVVPKLFWKAACAALVAWMTLAPVTSQARWLRAETRRFVVYSDGDKAELEGFARKLSSFDLVLRARHGVEDREVGRKLDVYLVRGPLQLQRVQPRVGYGVGGFYRATPAQVMAVAIRDERGLGADDVLFHEYTHHFMLEYFPAAYPAWLIEGYAEYFSTAQITPEAIELGRYNTNRAGMLRQVNWLFLGDLITAKPSDLRGEKVMAFYGQSWLLTHYMMMDDKRAAAFDVAIRAIADGKPPVEAMERATGKKMGALNEELRRYFHGKLMYRRAANTLTKDLPVAVTELPPSADGLLLESVSLAGPMTGNDGRALLRTVRQRAGEFPDDRLANFTLVRAEMRFGDVDKAEALLKRRLASDPRDSETLRLLGELELWRGDKDKDKARKAEFYKVAKGYLARAFAIDGDDYRTLYAYARARSEEPGYPDANTVNALLLALQLAPSVDSIRMRAGEGLLSRDQKADAIAVLTPLANSPHDETRRLRAAALIAAARGEGPPPAGAKVAEDEDG